MPLSLRRGVVTAILESHEELLRVEVDGVACVAYPHVTGPVEVADDVLVNVQARELELGSGGFDVLYANLSRGLGLEPETGAHVMVLPYTPLQHAVLHVEEDAASETLPGTPVVCCSLHSQVAPACAALSGVEVAYVQVSGGALPVSLSDTVRALRARRLVAFTVAAAPCVDADVQTVNVYSAFAYAAAAGADAIVCSLGPGIVGTGTSLGHGGLATAQAVNAAAALGGRPVLAPRVSRGDTRARHRGLSHHTEAVLGVCLAEPRVPIDLEPAGWRDACAGLPLSHMGRGPDDDPEFFAAAFAAGLLARGLLS